MDGLTALHHAISEGHGDAAIQLLKAGAEADKRDSSGTLAIDLAPDTKVGSFSVACIVGLLIGLLAQVRRYILDTAEREGIELP